MAKAIVLFTLVISISMGNSLPIELATQISNGNYSEVTASSTEMVNFTESALDAVVEEIIDTTPVSAPSIGSESSLPPIETGKDLVPRRIEAGVADTASFLGIPSFCSQEKFKKIVRPSSKYVCIQ
ncbi:unnamed protein product [Orchesella dallaii]|uniref:Uncharacterized protein n=1 Tax=Orchesella dallaii TaxID=48710 RepID=A0ABP1PPY7_9HEXA